MLWSMEGSGRSAWAERKDCEVRRKRKALEVQMIAEVGPLIYAGEYAEAVEALERWHDQLPGSDEWARLETLNCLLFPGCA